MPSGTNSVAYFDGTYAETVALMHEARDYFVERQHRGGADSHAAVQLVASCEAMRVTARLAQVLAWLLVQRAVHAGEILPTEAVAEDRRLGGRSVCAVEGPWQELGLPERLQALLARSLALYNRVARLDDLAAGNLNPAND
jgi:regulator of CtrA degradation